MFDFTELNFYQLENLILQKVPFTFFDLSGNNAILSTIESMNPYYQNFFKSLRKSVTINDLDTIEALLPKDAPIILCHFEKDVIVLLQKNLEDKGYLNCYRYTLEETIS